MAKTILARAAMALAGAGAISLGACVQHGDAASAPTHRYVTQQDGMYVYGRQPTEDEKRQGKATSTLLVRYLGERDGAYSIKMVNGEVDTVVSCSRPCQSARSLSYLGTKLIDAATVPVTDGSVVQAIMQDAMSGQLERYTGQVN
jgi:hypothetical protein